MALRMRLGCWYILALFCFAITSVSHALMQQDEFNSEHMEQYAFPYNFSCFARSAQKITSVKYPSTQQLHVGLQVSRRVTDQLMARIFAIFLKEVLNYDNVSLVPLREEDLATDELVRLTQIMTWNELHDELPDLTMINLAVWMPVMGRDTIHSTTVYDASWSMPPGRFGWFVPDMLLREQENLTDSLNYNIFTQPNSSLYAEYIIEDAVLDQLLKTAGAKQFVSPLCEQRKCVTFLAENEADTAFVTNEIEEMNLYVNVIWLGSYLKSHLTKLLDLYDKDIVRGAKKFVVLHWKPSHITDDNIIFQQISLPRCEEVAALPRALCKYELTSILKYSTINPTSEVDERLKYALKRFRLLEKDLKYLYAELRKRTHNDSSTYNGDIYDAVACQWLQSEESRHLAWLYRNDEPLTINIGGIFPITQTNRGHQNLVRAVQRAKLAINKNATILSNYKLQVLENDGQCKADLVLKAFINYFNLQNVLGVLGPACSETVEPIAGISKHANMAVISYSAEGATFLDRKDYPFFFRTIGSNRQYEDAYIHLMKHMGWRRIAALSEDGQKYTEYISHMEASMKQHNFELIINKKFLSDVTAAQMNKHLLDLKTRRAKIIIADIGNVNTMLALCEAYKLGMTAHQGYIWFLPSWLSKNLQRLNETKDSCSRQELEMAFDGHFTIMHTPFGDPNALMQENKTIKEWLDNYNVGGKLGNISNYAGFAYDAVWAYALATDRLLREDRDAISNMRTDHVVKRFVELLWQTDFQGLSGRVRFGQGGSRITDLNIMQWRRTHFEDIGKFYVNIVGNRSTLRTNGGRLQMQDAKIKWLSGAKIPGDGTYDCSFAALAELLGTDCDSASMAFTSMFCLLAVVFVSIISFFFWKKRYDNKLKQSAKIMKNFGIDLLSPSRGKSNTLDKWEIPKENVVINRRLGEGAFGTVYGGEALLTTTDCWSAVAVKTLKAGASMEDRLDFLSEAEAMKRFDHKNIVKLLGVCLQSEPIYTIMEFMLYGDLKTYLLARRHLVHEKVSDDSDICSKRLTMYAMDVARGLSYLAQQKYVHRDVACRNCLVNAERVVKLGDFGMSRPTYESDYYRFNRKGMLPVRWMAPESLALGMFTPASDVWAFGVVLYEIITFGSFPYQGLTNNQALEFIKSGKTLQVPNGAKPQLEALIKACWSQEVKKRPAAKEIVEYISNYTRLLTPCLDFPGASVEMPETESDQLELLPKLRKCSPHKKDSTLDILAQTSGASDECYNQMGFNADANETITARTAAAATAAAAVASFHMNTSASIMIPRSNNCNNQQQQQDYNQAATTPDGYSVMVPLLMHQISESSDSSQAMLLRKPSIDKQQQTKL